MSTFFQGMLDARNKVPRPLLSKGIAYNWGYDAGTVYQAIADARPYSNSPSLSLGGLVLFAIGVVVILSLFASFILP